MYLQYLKVSRSWLRRKKAIKSTQGRRGVWNRKRLLLPKQITSLAKVSELNIDMIFKRYYQGADKVTARNIWPNHFFKTQRWFSFNQSNVQLETEVIWPLWPIRSMSFFAIRSSSSYFCNALLLLCLLWIFKLTCITVSGWCLMQMW